MRILKFVLVLFLIFLAMVFFNQNIEVMSQTMVLRFDAMFASWKSVPLPNYLIIMLSFLIGGLFATAYFFQDKRRMHKVVKESKREKKQLEEELTSLRNMPLEDKVFSSRTSLASPSINSTSSPSMDDEEKTLVPTMNGE